LEQLVPVFVDSAHRTPRYGSAGAPALGPRDVVYGRLNFKNARLVDEKEFAIQTERRVPKPGDIVYSRELSYGWAAVIPNDVKVCLSQGMCLFRPHGLISCDYLLYVLNGPIGRAQAANVATGSAHPHINLGDIKSYCIPLPPATEQLRIARELDNRISILDHVEIEVRKLLLSCENLRKSVLAQAFTGKLVAQDATDEPAAELLKRICAESDAKKAVQRVFDFDAMPKKPAVSTTQFRLGLEMTPRSKKTGAPRCATDDIQRNR